MGSSSSKECLEWGGVNHCLAGGGTCELKREATVPINNFLRCAIVNARLWYRGAGPGKGAFIAVSVDHPLWYFASLLKLPEFVLSDIALLDAQVPDRTVTEADVALS